MQYLWIFGLLLPLMGAALGIRAATIEVRDNIDGFIGDLKRQGRWNAAAAIATAIGALCVAVGGLLHGS